MTDWRALSSVRIGTVKRIRQTTLAPGSSLRNGGRRLTQSNTITRTKPEHLAKPVKPLSNYCS